MKLYSYFRSSAAYRVRIALNLKGIAYETVSVHLIKDGGHNKRPEFRAVNPQMRVPVLVTPEGDVLIQSLAIIEYLDETHPEPPLLPKDPIARAKVRALAELIACDIHPLNNTSPLRYLKNEHGARSRARSTPGIITGSSPASRRSKQLVRPGPYACGNEVTLADTLPRAAGRQCTAAESAARQVSQDRRRRRRLSGARGLRPGAAGKPAGRGVIDSSQACSHFSHHSGA